MTTLLHVHRLPVSTTDSELQRLFEGVGRVINCDVVTDGTTRDVEGHRIRGDGDGAGGTKSH